MRDPSKMEPEQETFFTGVGDPTCHRFIRSVREKAIQAEKDTDDRWMANQASIKFDGEALKWFESLEDETQTDWKRLRRAILARYAEPMYEESARSQPEVEQAPSTLTLKGKDKDECREFVRPIRIRAQAERKINDPMWMCEMAYPCFAGDALEWHASLPMDVKNDWYRLERAILVDVPRQATLSLSPARMPIDNWWSTISSSPEMRSLRSREQWLSQARERRRMYVEAGDYSIPCWLLVETPRDIPDNAIETGNNGNDEPRYSARTWIAEAGLIVGKVGPAHKGAMLPLNKKEIIDVTPFEVLVGDPSRFHWIMIPDNKPAGRKIPTHRPFNAVEAGIEIARKGAATFIGQLWHEGCWIQGKAHSNGWSFICYGGRETNQRPVRVLAWTD